MLEPQVWREAATQVFFALGLGFGGVIAFSSYNKRDNNCHFDAALVSVINFVTSILATLVVFAVLGFKANVMNEKCVVEWVFPPVTAPSPLAWPPRSDSLIFFVLFFPWQECREDPGLPEIRRAEQRTHPLSHQLLPPLVPGLRRDVRCHQDGEGGQLRSAGPGCMCAGGWAQQGLRTQTPLRMTSSSACL